MQVCLSYPVQRQYHSPYSFTAAEELYRNHSTSLLELYCTRWTVQSTSLLQQPRGIVDCKQPTEAV
jgi:hypothetical protein